MKPVHSLLVWLLAVLAFASGAQAQVARQNLTFVVFGQYQTNEIATNTVLTNELKWIDTVVVDTANMVKILAVEHAGLHWTNLYNTTLVRETEFTNGSAGREGIFLYRYYPPTNVNVSTNFALCFSNDFRQNVPAIFPGLTNPGVNPEVHGGVFAPGVTNGASLTSDGLFSVAFYTTNFQFNLLGYGRTDQTNLVAVSGGTRYSGPVETLQALTGVGTYGLNIGTNFFTNSIVGSPNTNIVSGPAHGYFLTGLPYFITNSAESVFGP